MIFISKITISELKKKITLEKVLSLFETLIRENNGTSILDELLYS